jgi:microcystin-dependent protein
MAQPYIGEIRMFAGNFPPQGWVFCDGTLLPISENETHFQLIGTTYGGDGQSTFGVPDMRGRMPVHQGSGMLLAESGGVETVTLNIQQIPAHTHAMLPSLGQATDVAPANLTPASPPLATVLPYGTDNPLGSLAGNSVAPIGGSQPHENMHPFLGINFILSLFGLFPSQT